MGLYLGRRDDLDQLELVEGLLEVPEVAGTLVCKVLIEACAIELLVCDVRFCLRIEEREWEVPFAVDV